MLRPQGFKQYLYDRKAGLSHPGLAQIIWPEADNEVDRLVKDDDADGLVKDDDADGRIKDDDADSRIKDQSWLVILLTKDFQIIRPLFLNVPVPLSK